MTATPSGPNTSSPTPQFVRLTDMAEMFSISAAQAYALVRSGEIPAIKVGGRGQWRVEVEELERYITQNYADTPSLHRRPPLRLGEGQRRGR